jgi:hypothetical protein
VTPAPAVRTNPADTASRRAFARAHIDDAARTGPIPRYGTADWHRLPYADPRRWAAVLIAAECWATDGDNLAANLHTELAAAHRTHRQLEDEDLDQKLYPGAGHGSWFDLQWARGEATAGELRLANRRFLMDLGMLDDDPAVPTLRQLQAANTARNRARGKPSLRTPEQAAWEAQLPPPHAPLPDLRAIDRPARGIA